jgi:hypothetical protein
MRQILILDSDEIPSKPLLLNVFIELCQAFEDRGYSVRVINTIDDITDNSIVFMSPHIKIPAIVNRLNTHAPNAIYIGWYWHDIETRDLKYFIHTYENMLKPHECAASVKAKPNSAPFLLRASEDPANIGKLTKSVMYDYCYMGWGYCQQMIPSAAFKGFCLSTYDHQAFLPYDERRTIYLASTFALGFQSDSNIANEHVSQRIFEGMAYGCIVLTNSLPACQQTEQIAVYVDSREDLENKMRFYMNNPDLIIERQRAGYEFIKRAGTNHLAIDVLIRSIYDNYQIDI